MRFRTGMTVLAAVFWLTGCGKNISNTPPPDGGNSAPAAQVPSAAPAPALAANSGTGAQAGGLQWGVPEGWAAQPERPMRAATYSVPAETGDAEAGECAVFYFGPNEGGGVQANIDRWVGQMKQPDGSSSAAKAKTQKLDGAVPITLVDLTGTYLATSGPMMQVSAEKPGFRMMGAIVQGPQGAVFFKFTGPEKTVGANAQKFLAMVQGAKLAN